MGPMAVLRRHLFDPTSEERKRLKNKISGVFMGRVQLWGFTVEMALVVHAKIFISKIVVKEKHYTTSEYSRVNPYIRWPNRSKAGLRRPCVLVVGLLVARKSKDSKKNSKYSPKAQNDSSNSHVILISIPTHWRFPMLYERYRV